MSWIEIKALKEQRATLVNAARAVVAEAGKRDTENRNLNAEERQNFDKISADAKDVLDQINKLEELAKEDRSVKIGREGFDPKDDAKETRTKQKQAFSQFLRSGATNVDAELRGYLKPGIENRDLMVGSTIVGPRDFAGQVDIMKDFTGVIEAGATIINTSDGNPYTYLVTDDTNNYGAVLGEGVCDLTAVDPSEVNVTLGAFKYTSKWVRVTLERLQDSAYPIEEDIDSDTAERIGRKLNLDTTKGSGSLGGGVGARGFLLDATASTALAANNAITFAELVRFVTSLPYIYRKNRSKVKLMFNETRSPFCRRCRITPAVQSGRTERTASRKPFMVISSLSTMKWTTLGPHPKRLWPLVISAITTSAKWQTHCLPERTNALSNAAKLDLSASSVTTDV